MCGKFDVCKTVLFVACQLVLGWAYCLNYYYYLPVLTPESHITLCINICGGVMYLPDQDSRSAELNTRCEFSTTL